MSWFDFLVTLGLIYEPPEDDDNSDEEEDDD